MARRVNTINSLERMGYLVIDLGSMYKVILETNDGLIFERYVSHLELDTGNYIVESIVDYMNYQIKRYPFKEVSRG